jgi:hypothetical protein
MKIGMRCSAAFFLALSSQPAVAAEDFRDAEISRTTAGFVGLNLQMKMGATHRAVPHARFAMGLVRYENASGIAPQHPTPAWLELGASRGGRAEFYFAGQRFSDVRNQLGFDQTTAALIGVGVIAVAVAVVATMNDDDDSDVHCQAVGVCPE